MNHPIAPINESGWLSPDVSSSTLQEVNARRIRELAPIMVYLGLLSFVGAIGNAFVIYLFSTKFKKATSACFVLWLGILDLVVCSIGMPFEIVDMTLSYTFTIGWPCTVFRFFIFAVVYCSALTLIVVAFDRFLKVCYPLRGWAVKPVKTLAATNAVGVVIALPVCLVFGTATTSTIEEGINGTECSITDDMHNTVWPVVYYTGVGAVFVVSILSLAVLYGRLVYTLVKRKRQMAGDAKWYNTLRTLPPYRNDACPNNHPLTADSPTQTGILTRKKTMKRIKRLRRQSNIANYPGYFDVPTERTSVIFACVSVGFIVSYLPSLIIIVMREIHKNAEEKYLYSSRASDLSYNLFIRSYFLNHAINPIIYGFLNPSFRRECRRMVCPCVKTPDLDIIDAPLESLSSSMQHNSALNVISARKYSDTPNISKV